MINSSKANRSTPQEIKEGAVIEVALERMSFGSKAVGRWMPPPASADELPSKPFVVFVEGSAPGETVMARIENVEKSYCDAEVVEILKPSPVRVQPPCPYFGKCGGCQWQHLSYDAQLEAKQGVVLHQLTRSTGQDIMAQIKQGEVRLHIHGATRTLGYRTRLQARFDGKSLGFFARNSKTFVPVDKCIVAHPKIQERWAQFLKTDSEQKPAATGELRKVEWTLTENGKVLEAWDEAHAAHGFTQIHEEQNLELISVVHKLVHAAIKVSHFDKSQALCIVDLYAGNGNLSNALAKQDGHTVIQVEAFQSPIQMNEDAHDILKVQSHVDPFLQRWKKSGRVVRASEGTYPTPKIIIADPPREGLKQCVKTLSELKVENLILVSCDPSTLARDLSVLSQSGYVAQEIHVLDMFPQTYHVETVLWLRRG